MGRALGMGTGRPEWRWGFFGQTREKLFKVPVPDAHGAFGASRGCAGTLGAEGLLDGAVREGSKPSVIYCTGSPLPSSRRSV